MFANSTTNSLVTLIALAAVAIGLPIGSTRAERRLQPLPEPIESLSDQPPLVDPPNPPSIVLEKPLVIPAAACPHYRIKFHETGSARRMFCDCCPSPVVTLEVPDPGACGCTVQIPLHVPACCTGLPTVKPRLGLFGRPLVRYQWECGFEVLVVFKQQAGIVVVETLGR